MTQQHYIEYLIATPGHYTCTKMDKHLAGEQAQSHDAISDVLRRERVTPRPLWEGVAPLLHDGPDAYLIVDDSVQDKRQSSGAEGGVVDGIGGVNRLHISGKGGDFFPVDFRLYAPDQGGKTKNDHFAEMIRRAKSDKRIRANTVLLDAWYASVGNIELVHRLGM